MANIRSANSFYVDTAASDAVASTTGNLAVSNIKVKHITMVSTASDAVLVLRDVTTGTNKLELRIKDANSTLVVDYEDVAILFPNGINPSTVTNTRATILVEETRSGG